MRTLVEARRAARTLSRVCGRPAAFTTNNNLFLRSSSLPTSCTLQRALLLAASVAVSCQPPGLVVSIEVRKNRPESSYASTLLVARRIPHC